MAIVESIRERYSAFIEWARDSRIVRRLRGSPAPQETLKGRFLRGFLFAVFIVFAISYNIGAIVPGFVRDNTDWKVFAENGLWGGFENLLPVKSSSFTDIYEAALAMRNEYMVATGVGEFGDESEGEADEEEINDDESVASRALLNGLKENLICSASEMAQYIQENQGPPEQPDLEPRKLHADHVDEYKDELEVCEQRIMLDDIFRVTATNINFVFWLSAFLIVTTLNTNSEVKRKWFDSLYFYGFILTLIALIMALSNVARVADGQLAVIVVQSAVALSSTVFALICRTVLIQLLVPANEDDEETQLNQLNLALEKLTTNLQSAGRNVATFKTQVKETNDGIKGAGKAIGDEVVSVTTTLRSKVDEISKIKIDQDLVVKQMAAAVKSTMDALKPEIDAMKEMFRNGTSETREAINGLNTVIDDLMVAVTSVETTTKRTMTEISIAVKEVVESSAASVATISKSAASMTERLASLDLSSIVSERLRGMLDAVARQLADEQSRLGTAVTDILAQLEKARGSQERTAEATLALAGRIEEQNIGLANITLAFAALNERVDGTFADPAWVSKHAAKLDELSEANTKLLAATRALDASINERIPRRITLRVIWESLFVKHDKSEGE